MTDKEHISGGEVDRIDEMLGRLPVVKPRRDLVAAAVTEAIPARLSFASVLLRFAVPIAAAAAIAIAFIPRGDVPTEATTLPTDAEIAALLMKSGARSDQVRSRVHVATYEKESLSLSERISRVRKKTEAWKKEMEKGMEHV